MKTKTRTNHSQRRILTDAAIRSLAVGKTATESLPGRGTGAILFEVRSSGNIESYFRVRVNNKSQKIKIGTFKSSARITGLSLVEIREIARTYSLLALEHGDVKKFLEERREAEEREIRERELAFSEALLAASEEKSTASFEELFID